MRKRRSTPGERLRKTRLRLGLTLRDVHTRSLQVASKLGNKRFVIPAIRLHDAELKNRVPSIHRLYTLAQVYGRDVQELLGWYGIPP
jgi:transcriptional regulator with XRE-family HTH domain